MTTGRINQVTIVCRGWPTGACFSAGESSKLLGGARGRARQSAAGQACSAHQGNPLSPSQFPRASFRRTDAPKGGAAWGPQEEDSARSIYHCGVRHAWLPPVARVSGVASGQPSTEPIRQRSGRAPAAVFQASPVRRAPGGAAFVGVDQPL